MLIKIFQAVAFSVSMVSTEGNPKQRYFQGWAYSVLFEKKKICTKYSLTLKAYLK